MLYRRPLLHALWIVTLFPLLAYPQTRPRSLDDGDTRVTPRAVTEKVRGSVSVLRRAAYNWVIVRPALDKAEVRIDGKLVPKSKDDDYRMELPVGRRYTVAVSAGADYDSFQQSYKMQAKEPEIIEPPLKYRFGSLKIITAEEALEGARVLIDGKPQKVAIDKSKSALTLDRLEPGKHLITFDHPDYVLHERNAQITPDTEYTWTLFPARPFVELEVDTLPRTKVYVDNELKDETADGKLKLSDIKPGPHQVKMVKNGYEEYNETHEFVYPKPVRIAHRMKPRQPSTDFQCNFKDTDANVWTLPRGAQIAADHLTISPATALAQPQGVFYWNFEMQFHLRLESAGGAAWALRADDANNYYLFYLSGPQGRGRTATFTTYVVRDGKLDMKNPIVSPVDTGISAETGYEYTVLIEARDNVINHKIIPVANKNLTEKPLWGTPVNLGTFTDENRLFLFGGFGFRSVGTEKFSISEMYVKSR